MHMALPGQYRWVVEGLCSALLNNVTTSLPTSWCSVLHTALPSDSTKHDNKYAKDIEEIENFNLSTYYLFILQKCILILGMISKLLASLKAVVFNLYLF